MIRILFDEEGDSHSDIFFKIDASPSFIQVADLYFVGDFLGTDKEPKTKEELMIAFIEYIKARVLSADKEEVFIPIDLSDQYVGGLLISRKNKELLKVKYASTTKFNGYGISSEQVDQMVKKQKSDFEIDGDWILSIEGIIKGLDWSKRKIQNAAQQKLW
jgi:hypothetical protein